MGRDSSLGPLAQVVNGRTYTKTYGAATRTYTQTSPTGLMSFLTLNDHGNVTTRQSATAHTVPTAIAPPPARGSMRRA